MSNFKREIKLFDAVMLVSGSMIGSGIFVVSADVARTVGSTGYLFLSWIIAGLITMIGALSYGELSGMFPNAGGQYLYLQKAYNKLIGFLYGWGFFLVIQTGTIAAVAVAFAKYAGVLFPQLISDNNVIFAVGDSSFKLTSQRLLAILSILLLTYNNTKGVKQGKIVQNIFSSTKLLALGLIVILGLAMGFNANVLSANLSGLFEAQQYSKTDSGLNIVNLSAFGIILALGVTQVGTLFSSDAWTGLAAAGDEVVEPQKTIPRGLALGTIVVTVLYLLVNFVYICILPLKGDPTATDVMGKGIMFAAEDRVAAAAAQIMGGDAFAVAVAILIMISTFGCNNGLILAGSRVYYTMAKDKLFFKKFEQLNTNGVPSQALWWQAAWASFLCLTGKYGDLLDFLMGVVILFYVLTIFGIFRLRKSMPDLARPVKAPLYPILPALYIILGTALILILIKERPQFAFPGFGIVALGIPVYYWFNKNNA
jgi:basic amino acid/polyamine antiporter, APA family